MQRTRQVITPITPRTKPRQQPVGLGRKISVRTVGELQHSSAKRLQKNGRCFKTSPAVEHEFCLTLQRLLRTGSSHVQAFLDISNRVLFIFLIFKTQCAIGWKAHFLQRLEHASHIKMPFA